MDFTDDQLRQAVLRITPGDALSQDALAEAVGAAMRKLRELREIGKTSLHLRVSGDTAEVRNYVLLLLLVRERNSYLIESGQHSRRSSDGRVRAA